MEHQREDTFIGDLLLTFGWDEQNLTTRITGSRWKPVKKESNWKIWTVETNENWKGFPLKFFSTEYYSVWLMGELYGKPSESFSNLTKFHDEEMVRLNGHFFLMAWDKHNHKWHILTDRFGTFHAYYSKDGQQAAIGTFAPAVAAVASHRKLDWLGLAGFFSFGFFPQDRTYFDDLRILKPASHYILDEKGRLMEEKRYWRWWHKPNLQRSYDDTVVEFDHIINKVISEETFNGRVAIPISGGLDSRSIVAAASQTKEGKSLSSSLWSYSYGYNDDSIETCIARKIASARNLSFQAFTIQPYLFDRLDLIMSSVEGFQDITQCRQAAVTDEIASHADYLIAGHWGDVWLDDIGLVNNRSQKLDNDYIFSHAFKKIRKSGRTWLLENICLPQLRRENPETLLNQMMEKEMATLQHIEDPDFRVKAFKTDQHAFRWTLASLRMFQPAAFPRLPFYDTRMADFFCTVPSKFLRKRQLQIDFLKRFAPDLAKITWQAYDTDLFKYQHFNSWLLPKRASKKAWRILMRKQVFERNWEVQFMGTEGRQGLNYWLLRAGLRLHEFVSPQKVGILLDSFYNAPLEQGRGYTVCMLLTFSVWLEKYG